MVAHVSHRARALAIALKGLREGLTREEKEWQPDIALAATLPARALRYLYTHSDVHLNVEFRDLRPVEWDGEITLADGGRVQVRETPLLRARDVWQSAVDLCNGARPADLPFDIG
jgi:maleylpyruvate isomerase